jgi:predicted thioredoxin/glutaredoxin
MRVLFTWAGLLAIFVAGCVTGGSLAGVFGKHKIEQVLRGDRKTIEKTVLGHMVKKLDLDSATSAVIQPIVKDTARDYLELRRKHAPEIDAILDRGIARIKEHLDPERSKKFDEMVQRMRSKRAALLQDSDEKPQSP